FLDMATTQINNGYAQIYATLLPTAEALIKARIAKAEKVLYVSIGVTLLLFLIMGYFAIGNYYVIISSIQSFTLAAKAFASGNLNMRVKLETRDELRKIGDSFNQMADGFSTLFEKQREDEHSLSATIETAMDAVVQMDTADIITGWNHQAEKVFGWQRAQAIGRPLSETIVPPQFREKYRQGLQHFMHTGECEMLNSRAELIGLHRDGHEFPIELSITAIKAAGKHKFNCFIRDITQKKQSEDLIWNQANFDPLTSLPNRRMFHDRLEQAMKKAQRANLKTALLYIDLDKFKEVNDTLGHNMGDTLLKEAAQRISGCVRATDTVARMGGDEFTVILAELDDTGSIGRISENILQSLAQPFLLGSETAYISASIGITLYPDDATDINELLMHADQAMYAAKNAGRNRYSYFMPPMQDAVQARLRLTNELRGALSANQFMLHYQPIVDLATGQIIKAEALIRWQHPELGTVSPAQFIPLAEETGLIVEIGDWVFKEAARQLKYWRTLYNINLQLSVNVSPVQLIKHVDGSYQAWFSYLQSLGLSGQSMVIEITEGLLLGASDTTDKLLEFRDAGIQVAIDDFGTGYSSLSYLKKFDIDYLKIDQSFVRDLATDPNDMALSEAIIVMAHKLGLKVIAEGVETEEQRRLLASAGCDYAQGYLFSRPLPAAMFELLLGKQLCAPIAPHGYATTMAAVS
ncbi:MAG: EAL domain-containing protein, partial [Methylophilaceae bacterium]